MDQPAHPIEILLHSLGVHQQFVHHPGQPREREIERDGGVGADIALDRRMADVALMPERHILQRRGDIAAHHAGQAGQILRQHRIALVRHRRRALLAGREIFLGLQHLGALQVTHLDRQSFDRRGDHAQGREEHCVAIARDHLGRDRLDRQAELARDILLHPRIDIGEGADRARDRASGDIGARRLQPRLVAREFSVGLGQLEPERHRLGMDAVAAPDRGGELMFERPALEHLEQFVDVGQQDVAGARELHCQAGVEHVGRGHALVHEARLVADILGHPGQEGDHVMLGHCLDRIDRGDVDRRVGRPPGPQRLGRRFRHHAQFAQRLGGMRLDLEPDAETGFGRPEGDHFGARITGDHRTSFRWMRDIVAG